MGHRCCSKQKVKRGLWSPEEDDKLIKHITAHGHGSWSSVPKLACLQRCGKSCRLRWINYLRPDLKRGSFTAEEEQIIIDVHRILGNRWAQIAKHLPGRTDNEVKNFWNSCIKKKLLSQGLDPKTHNLLSSRQRASSNHKPACQSEQPFTVSNMRSSNAPVVMMNMNMNPPVLTLPAPDHQLQQPMAPMQIPNSECQSHQINPNELPYVSSMDSNTMNMTSSSSSTTHHLSGFNYNLLDENPCINWDANVIVNETTFEALRVESNGIQQQQQQQEKENICAEMAIEKIVQGDDMNTDAVASFEVSCGFDLGLLESTLMSASMCRDFSSMDEFAWNF